MKTEDETLDTIRSRAAAPLPHSMTVLRDRLRETLPSNDWAAAGFDVEIELAEPARRDQDRVYVMTSDKRNLRHGLA